MTPAPLLDLLTIGRKAVEQLSYFDPAFYVRRVAWVASEIEGSIVPAEDSTEAIQGLRRSSQRIIREIEADRSDLEVWKVELGDKLDELEASLQNAKPNEVKKIIGGDW